MEEGEDGRRERIEWVRRYNRNRRKAWGEKKEAD